MQLSGCGYHGCNVIPPKEGCKCTECSLIAGICQSCKELAKRKKEQLEAYSRTKIYIDKCAACIQRAKEQ